MLKKIGFGIVWILTLVLPLFTIYTNTNFLLIKGNIPLQVNLAQRISGLVAFALLFWQIVLGAFMPFWVKKLGKWVFNFHVGEGLLIYLLILVHPLLFGFYLFKIKGGFDPFYLFADVCVLCRNRLEIFYTLGRLGIWSTTLAISAAIFKNIDPWLKRNWRKFHALNYLTFFLVALHAKLLGSDANFVPFIWFYWPAVLMIVALVIFKLYKYFKNY